MEVIVRCLRLVLNATDFTSSYHHFIDEQDQSCTERVTIIRIRRWQYPVPLVGRVHSSHSRMGYRADADTAYISPMHGMHEFISTEIYVKTGREPSGSAGNAVDKTYRNVDDDWNLDSAKYADFDETPNYGDTSRSSYQHSSSAHGSRSSDYHRSSGSRFDNRYHDEH